MSLVICTPGTAAAPSIEFGATNTGFYLDSDGNIACTIDGAVNELEFSQLWLRVPTNAASGTVAAGTLVFTGTKLAYTTGGGTWLTVTSS